MAIQIFQSTSKFPFYLDLDFSDWICYNIEWFFEIFAFGVNLRFVFSLCFAILHFHLLFPPRVLQCTGPTNTRKYHVAVYFRGDRLGTGIGHSIQRAEMNAAANALKEKQGWRSLLHTLKPRLFYFINFEWENTWYCSRYFVFSRLTTKAECRSLMQ